jgi:hypothetical protein
VLLQEKLVNFYTYFLNGEEESLLSIFLDLPRINTPFGGQITGKGEFLDFVTS